MTTFTMSNYTKVANICNNARENLFQETLIALEEGNSQAFEDVDADYLETIMDAFSNDDIAELEGVENVRDLIEHWKNIVMLNALKEFVKVLTEKRIPEWENTIKSLNRKVKLDQEYFEEQGQI